MSNENMAWFWAILSGASMIIPSSSHCAAVYAGLMCVLSCARMICEAVKAGQQEVVG